MSALNSNSFEREVADLYRSLGANARHDVSIAGNQIDVLVVEQTSTGTTVTRIVECKAYTTPVGVAPVRSFAALTGLLKERGLTDVATLVSANGFSRPAREAGKAFGIELLELADLRALVANSRRSHSSPPVPVPLPEPVESGHPTVFVALPFTPDYDDVYLYGISAAAEVAQVSVERADDQVLSDEIIGFIKDRLAACDCVVVDTTEHNANVFYELGFADALGARVLLIARQGADLPFDIRGRNHLMYANIKDLATRLPPRLKALTQRS